MNKNDLNITIDQTRLYSQIKNKNGDIRDIYQPFFNLINENGNLSEFTTNLLNLDENNPVDLIIQPSYDGSDNVIINDGKNIPRLINSRFSIQDNKTYEIPDHKGYKDTNLYDSKNFHLDTSLKKNITKIPKLEYKGLDESGNMKCGSYYFYFKLLDNDGNKSEIVAESGLVVCHIGKQRDPTSIRMGMEDENSLKSVIFELSNIDSAFDYVKVYFSRVSTDNSQSLVTLFFDIDYKYPINKEKCNIYITGDETILSCTKLDIFTDFANLDSCKTIDLCQNILFLGNILKKSIPYQELQNLSWLIIPSQTKGEKNIGSLTSGYVDFSDLLNPDNSFGYYNTKNIYYRLGYWPDEFYRFGVVFITEDFTLTPVFNVRGYDFNNIIEFDNILDKNDYLDGIKSEPEDYYFNKNYFENSKGVCRLKQIENYNTVVGINFNISGDVLNKLKELKIKGLFFVRQKCIPTILTQGLVIGKTKKDNGSIPVVGNNLYYTESFLDANRLLTNSRLFEVSNIENKAMLVPEAELREATYNQLFVSNEYCLQKIGSCKFTLKDRWFRSIEESYNPDNSLKISKLTNVPKETILTTNGEDYFSTVAGSADEAYKTVDAINVFNETKPQDLTESKSLVRGKFGSFVGMSNNNFEYGTLINIKIDSANEESFNENLFYKRFFTEEPYYPICDRLSLDELSNNIICYRGDRFIGYYTHRMISQFIDSELPTVDKVIDPTCWAKNYAVRNSVDVDAEPYLNAKGENKTKGWKEDTIPQIGFANEIVQAFEVDEDGKKYYITPDSLEKGSGNILNTVIKVFTPERELRGLSNINRADVNAIALGHWITFPISARINICMRDIDYSNPTEQATFNKKRSFFPLNNEMNRFNKLLDSTIINGACLKTLSDNPYYLIPDIPYFKLEFSNRIYYSNSFVNTNLANGYRQIFENKYQDYSKTFGFITCIKEYLGNLICVFDHAVTILPVKERILQGQGQGGATFINLPNILPETPYVITDNFGSMWKDSILVTKNGVYGVDTVAKKIWYYNNEGFACISDLKVLKFLNDNIDLSEFDKQEKVGKVNIKTHYNAFKHDVIFTYYREIEDEQGNIIKDTKWSLCWNEDLKKFITFYNWIPVNSANIDNIWFTFDRDDINTKSIWNYINFDENNFDEKHSNYKYLLNKNTIDKSFTYETNCYVLNSKLLPEQEESENYNIDNNLKIPTLNDYCVLTFYSNYQIEVFKENSTLTIKNKEYLDNFRFYFIIFDSKTNINIIFDTINSNFKITELKYTSGKNLKEILNLFIEGNIYDLESIIIEDKLECYYIKTYEKFNNNLYSNEYDSIKFSNFNSLDLRTYKPLFKLWKHGQAGLYDNQGLIKPTTWYNKTREFQFEFVVNKDLQLHKIFNNLHIISNKAEPYKFEFEVVGEVYEWYLYKKIIEWANSQVTDLMTLDLIYLNILSKSKQELYNLTDFPKVLDNYKDSDKIKKLPFIKIESNKTYKEISGNFDYKYTDNSSDTILIKDELLNEERIHTELLANNMKKYGRIKGNINYLEDQWKLEIRPIYFKYAYLNNNKLEFSKLKETRLRDKYLKVKVRYSGEDLAVILAINTMFDYSFA